MTASIILFSLIGAVLGMRYTVLSLVPITLAGLAGVALVAFANDVPANWAVGCAIVLALVLQGGYLVGIGASHLLVGARARAMAADEERADSVVKS